MTEELLIKFFKSKNFKKFTLFLGVLFLLLTFVIYLDPKPFLRFGYFGIFVFNLVGPGTLLAPFLFQYFGLIGVALASASGMAINDSVSWLIGSNSDVVLPRSDKVARIRNSLSKFGPLALFFWSLIPFPYDLIGLLAGYLGFSYSRYIIPTFLGKFIRFLLLGAGITAAFKARG